MGIVLAAGEGSRWDGPGHKLLAPLSDGRPVIVHAVEAAVESGIGPVAVVWGAVSVATRWPKTCSIRRATASSRTVKAKISVVAPGIVTKASSPSQVLQIQPLLESFCT